MILNNDIWILNIKEEVSTFGLVYMFHDTSSNQFKNHKMIKCIILDIFKQNLMSSFSSLPKRFLYQHFINNLTYLMKTD